MASNSTPHWIEIQRYAKQSPMNGLDAQTCFKSIYDAVGELKI